MCRILPIVLGTVGLILIPCHHLHAQPTDRSKELDALRAAIISAKNPREAAGALKACFGKADKERLEQLQNDPDIGIALQAAYELARKPGGNLPSSPQRFLGYFEGRTNVKVPIDWEVSLTTDCLHWKYPELLRAALKGYASIAPSVKRDDEGGTYRTLDKREKNDLGLFTYGGTRIRAEDKTLAVTVGRDTIRIPADLLARAKKENPFARSFKVLIGPRLSIVALHDDAGDSFPLFCLDTRSGEEVWNAEAWGYGGDNVPLKTGVWFHTVSLVMTDKLVVLFEDGGGCSVEAFELATGRQAYRFTTNFWMTRPHPSQ